MRKYLLLTLFCSTLSFAYESVIFKEDPELYPGLKDLTVKFQMLDGVQPQTLGKRFIKSSYKRGEGKMDIWCSDSLKGNLIDDKAFVNLECRQQRGFGEDNAEHFDLNFKQKFEKSEEGIYENKGVKANFYYSGDYTQFADEEIATVFGEGNDDREYSEKEITRSEGSGIEKNPFQLGESINQNLSTLLGTTITIVNDDVESRGPIRQILWGLSSKSELSLQIYIGDNNNLYTLLKPVSTLKTLNELNSGYDFTKTLERITEQLKIVRE